MARNAERRAEWTEAATDYVLEHGLIGLSLRPLAADLGTSDRMLLYHFGSKDELVAAVLRESNERSTAHVRAMEPSRDLRRAVHDLWAAMLVPQIYRCSRLYVEAAALGLLGQEPYASVVGEANDPGPRRWWTTWSAPAYAVRSRGARSASSTPRSWASSSTCRSTSAPVTRSRLSPTSPRRSPRSPRPPSSSALVGADAPARLTVIPAARVARRRISAQSSSGTARKAARRSAPSSPLRRRVSSSVAQKTSPAPIVSRTTTSSPGTSAAIPARCSSARPGGRA